MVRHTLFIALGTFGQISDVLQSKFFAKLSERYHLVVLTDIIDAKTTGVENYLLRDTIEFKKLKIHQPRLWDIFRYYFRLPFIREYDAMLPVQRWWYKPTNPFRLRFLIKVGSIFPKNFPHVEFITGLEKFLARPSFEFKALVKQYRPQLLITASPGYISFEAEMIMYAKKLNIPTAAIALNFDHLESQAKFTRKTDWIAVWSKRMENDARFLAHFKPTEIAITGPLRFDHYLNDPKEGIVSNREEFFRRKNLNPRKKLILYATSTPGAYPPRKEFITALLRLKKDGLLCDSPNILVRLHPCDIWEPYKDFFGITEVYIERAGSQRVSDEDTKGAKVEMTKADLVNATESFRYADVVINYSSTTTLEACLFNKPVISIGFPESYRWVYELPANIYLRQLGVIQIAKNMEELKSLINNLLQSSESEQDNYHAAVAEFVGLPDGLSWKRTFDFIEKCIAA